MSQWYLSKNGQALGPLEEDKVVALIEAGDLSPVDLIYKSGESEWLPLSQVDTFAKHFQKAAKEPETAPQPQAEKEWVLLKKVSSEKGKEYKQLGPFAHEQVMELLDSGQIRFTDFAWKEGMESWAKIGELDVFSEPLPSSPKIDMSLYEKTSPEIQEITVVDEEQKASMTEMVNIQTFEHQKTQVMSREELFKSVQSQRKQAAPEPEPEPEVEYAATEPDAPINKKDFATQTDVEMQGPEDVDSDEISLWSLEPPSAKQQAEAEAAEKGEEDITGHEETRVVSLGDKKKAFKNLGLKAKPKNTKTKSESKSKPAPPKKRPKSRTTSSHKLKGGEAQGSALGEMLNNVDSETWLWMAAVGTVALSVLFFFMSFQTETPAVVYDEAQNYSQNQMDIPRAGDSQIPQNQPAAPAPRQVAPAPTPVQNIPTVQEVKKPQVNRELEKQKAVQLAVQKVRKQEAEKKRQALAQEQKRKAQAAAAQKKLQAEAEKRRLASQKKRKSIQEQAKKMSRSKKKVAPKKSKAKSKRPRSSRAVSRPAGGPKAQSFYRQRDRKALFYSSLKAETLVVDIERQFRKLRKNKAAWRKFYGQWRKKVRTSLSKDIREFPKSNEFYAYPDFFKKFKRDYELFYRYGEAFNVKVVGGRVPSGLPTNMQAVFSAHKSKAKSLGL